LLWCASAFCLLGRVQKREGERRGEGVRLQTPPIAINFSSVGCGGRLNKSEASWRRGYGGECIPKASSGALKHFERGERGEV